MEITYSKKEANLAELFIDGKQVSYRIPPVVGTHSDVFGTLSADKQIKIATGREIAAYAHGCLVHRKNEWADQDRVKFPSQRYLRFPEVLTIVPNRNEFGDLAGGMLVDSDLKGEGIKMQTDAPKDLSGFVMSDAGILVNNAGRIFVPYSSYYQEQWGGKNGASVALAGIEGAELMEKTAVDSGRSRTLWKVDVNSIRTSEKRVPVLDGYDDGRLYLDCDDVGYDGDGCGVGVLVSAEGTRAEK